ncbi:hypothetical protein LJC59_03375 [Desulfovibrio sp. OttesenSCG-928-A18]|nr:hypothetical protein [Desulfovibrio sp. OttesenSCG-928-A18]
MISDRSLATIPKWRAGNGHITPCRACLFFCLAALFGRAVCNIGFLERPISIGLAWWLITGDYAPALPLALFFEIFWLDLFFIGGYIPPMAAFPYLLFLALAGSFGWNDPTSMAFPLVMLLPFAYLVPYHEARQRDLQKNASSKLLAAAQGESPLNSLPGRMLVVSSLQILVGGAVLFIAAYYLLYALFSLAVFNESAKHIPLNVNWTVLYGAAAIGALLALRIRKAFLVFGMCVLALLLLQLM